MAVKKLQSTASGELAEMVQVETTAPRRTLRINILFLLLRPQAGMSTIAMAKSEKRKSDSSAQGQGQHHAGSQGSCKAVLLNIDNPKSPAYQKYELILDEVVEMYTMGLSVSQVAQVYQHQWCRTQ
jgi:hypothetical protein